MLKLNPIKGGRCEQMFSIQQVDTLCVCLQPTGSELVLFSRQVSGLISLQSKIH